MYPELHLFGDEETSARRNQTLLEAAVPLDGPLVRELAELAADLKIWLVPGSICELSRDGQLFNTALAFSPEGQLVASYRKIFPWRPFEPYEPGDRFVVFDIDGVGRFGLSICYDAWFPEHSRQLAWLGAEVILNVVKTTTPDRQQGACPGAGQRDRQPGVHDQRELRWTGGRGQEPDRGPGGHRSGRGHQRKRDGPAGCWILGHVDRVRQFGTAGLNRMWSRTGLGGPDGGVACRRWIDPVTWAPRR